MMKDIKELRKVVKVIQKICNCSNFMLSDSKHVPMKTRMFFGQ